MQQQEWHDEDTAPLPDDVSGGTAGNANDRARKLEEIRRAAGIRPTVSIPRDPQAIADVLAALVRADIRRGVKISLKGLLYMPDKGGDYFAAPEEVRHKGGDDCDGLTRAAGGHRGRWVGCVRVPNGRGFHVFLIDDAGRIDDPSVTGGMPKPPPNAYEGAARSQIRPPAVERLKTALRRAVGRGGNAARLALRSVDVPVAALARSEQEALRREVLAEVERVSATLPPAEAEELRRAALDELAAAERGDGAVSGTGDEGNAEVEEPGHETAPEDAEDVGLWDDVVRAVGTVASVVVGAVATPAAGAGVAVATGAVATAVGEAEKAAKKSKQPHPKDPKRSDAAAVHAAAQAAMKAAPPASEQAKAHAALAAVSSPDPKVQRAIRSRLATPAAKDPAPADRARLLAAAVALRKLNYRLPLEDTRPQAAPPAPAAPAPAPAPAPQVQAAPQETAVAPERAPRRRARFEHEEEALDEVFDLFDFEGWAEDVEGITERVGCPGTCAVR
ncbi:hypothetical protein [Sorangium sp. So ce1024]|uniref:hypothetical protein n=1 Tax=Sorangium sp. So ce1024 TaxID=3133327 RepID=UPI003EFF5445